MVENDQTEKNTFEKKILEENTAWEHVNKGLNYMGSQSLVEIVKHILNQNNIDNKSDDCDNNREENKKENGNGNGNKKNNIKWVSVGSGNGVAETWMQDSFGIKIYKVDPEPNIFNAVSKEFQETFQTQKNHYYKLDTLMNDIPSIKGNCVLFLNWCCYLNSRYDMDAIEKLSPVYIICLCEVSTGISGGMEFQQWLLKSVIEKEKNEEIKFLLQSIVREKDFERYGLKRNLQKEKEEKYAWRGGKFRFGEDELGNEAILANFLLKRKDVKECETKESLNIAPYKMETDFKWEFGFSYNGVKLSQEDSLILYMMLLMKK